MCVSCGCGAPEDKHGDQRNITLSELRSAAEAAGVGMATLSRNLQQGLSPFADETNELAKDMESMNQPLPNGQFQGKLESTPYTE